MENPSRIEAFPVGLRVLVVDDDPTWLKVVEKMLRKCSYEVTTCSLARTALDLLREGKEKFDIVISDVNMPDMDGFKLLEHVGLEMDLPVIMMSVDGETSKVMKGVQHGACDYLLKPIRMKELRNIWQHVYRKKILEVREIEGHDIIEGMPLFRNGSEDFDDRLVSALKKRKDMDSKEYSDRDYSDLTSLKKARVVWSVDLHQKFVNAVDQIGYDKVGPKKILDLMNVPGLTRENVASHLQKYRLYLSRLLKQNEAKSYGRNMQSECSPVALQPNFELQSAPIMHQNNGTSKYLPIPITGALHTQNRTPDIHTDQKSTVTVDVRNRKEAPNNGKMNGSSPLGITLSFKGTTPNVDYKSVEPFMPKHQANPCTSHMPLMQFMQYPKHAHKPYSLFEDYPSQVQNQPSIIFSNSEKEYEIDKHGVVTPQVSGTKREFDGPANMKNAEDLPLCPLQNSCCFENIGLNAMELFQYNDSTSLTGFQSNWYDGLESNGEDLYDLVEYPTIDDCLFA